MGYPLPCWESWWPGPGSGNRTPSSHIPWAIAETRHCVQRHWNLKGSGLAHIFISTSCDVRTACEKSSPKINCRLMTFFSNNGTAHVKRTTLWYSLQETWQVDYRVAIPQSEDQKAGNRVCTPNKLHCWFKSMVCYLSWEIQFYNGSR